jgi:hypothetical protein
MWCNLSPLQVKQNFERFISCKTTIDDIYVKLRRIESHTAGASTEVLYNAIKEVGRPSWATLSLKGFAGC